MIGCIQSDALLSEEMPVQKAPIISSSRPPAPTNPLVKSEQIRPEDGHRRGRWFLAGGLILFGAGVAVAVATHFDWTALHRELLSFPPVTSIVLMAALPLVGFSIAAVYVIAGAKFGLAGGGALIAALTAFHLVASHLIARTILRRPLERRLARYRGKLPALPPGEGPAVAILLALVPGLPYFVRNYLLALSGIPFRTYFWLCLPIYVLRSYVTLSLGDLSGELTRHKLVVLGVIYAVKLAICAYLLRRVQKRLRAAKNVSDQEKPRLAGS
jgi:uncharacterized membrane protein YdjX (TVP38/TMEM64 family)